MNQPSSTSYQSISAQYGRLISAHLPCPDVTLPKFLQCGRGDARYYWESSQDDVAFAGIGTALEITAYGPERFESIHHSALELFADALVLDEQNPLAAPRLFGGFSFRDEFVPDDAWSDFPPAHFVLPHYQLVRVGASTWLTINAHVPYGENPNGLLTDLHEALQAKIADLQQFATQQFASQAPTDLSYPMPYETWEQNIQAATQRMKQGDLNKVVLSRVAEVCFDETVNVDRALDYLAATYPETYRFLFEPRQHRAFYGATPELLVQMQGTQLTTMALAGSIQRGATPEETTAYGQALLDSAKDRYEHQLVIDGIRERLLPLAATVTVGETEIMTLSNIQHIHTPITATLKSSDGVLPVVDALHPTPALGGDPQAIAMSLMGRYEPVPRGWYAAPVGWIDRHLNGQFGVAIRSAVAQDKRVWLYAGAGIVKDSEPRKEWDETTLKFTPMLRALGINAEHTDLANE